MRCLHVWYMIKCHDSWFSCHTLPVVRSCDSLIHLWCLACQLCKSVFMGGVDWKIMSANSVVAVVNCQWLLNMEYVFIVATMLTWHDSSVVFMFTTQWKAVMASWFVLILVPYSLSGCGWGVFSVLRHGGSCLFAFYPCLLVWYWYLWQV